MENMCGPQIEILLLATTQWQTKFQGNDAKEKNYVEYSECILCDTNIVESIIHLFFECSFSQSFWWALGFE
jgi:hypothetical protein